MARLRRGDYASAPVPVSGVTDWPLLMPHGILAGWRSRLRPLHSSTAHGRACEQRKSYISIRVVLCSCIFFHQLVAPKNASDLKRTKNKNLLSLFSRHVTVNEIIQFSNNFAPLIYILVAFFSLIHTLLLFVSLIHTLIAFCLSDSHPDCFVSLIYTLVWLFWLSNSHPDLIGSALWFTPW